MTIFGPDIYNGQAGLALTSLRYASYVLAKTTEGTYYIDKSYQSWRRQAQAANQLFLWYHFLTRENVAAQVANTKANVGDLSLPGMLDAETEYGYTPTWKQILDYIDAAHAAGLNLRLLYLPHWVWEQMGSPDLTGLKPRKVYLVSSSYPGGAGSPLQIYPGDHYPGWDGYGGMPVTMAQFTDQGLDGGMRIDYNAFQGTVDQFRQLLYPDNTPTTGGPDVELTDTVTISQGFTDRYPDVNNPPDGFTTGAKIPVSLLWEGAALRAVHNEHLLTGMRDQLAALVAKVGGGVDVAQLAADLGPLLHPTTDVNALAALLAPHVGVPDAAAFAAALAPHIKIESA